MAANRRSQDDWTALALTALADGGVAAVAVEPLAARAGATKGSVYWHFANRDALLEATLRRWEREHTEDLVTIAERGATPADRLRLLFDALLSGEISVDIELALLSSTGHPVVRTAVSRVTERRVAYLAALFVRLRFTRAQARRRAAIAYSLYLGQAQLLRSSAVKPRSERSRRALVADILRALLAEPGEV